MFLIKKEVHRGIVFITLIGKLNKYAVECLSEEINYLLYDHGLNSFVFDFYNIDEYEQNVMLKLQNKLVEIFLSCGRIVFCGLKEQVRKNIGKYQELFFVSNEIDAFRYFDI